jgi:hypothetical protein
VCGPAAAPPSRSRRSRAAPTMLCKRRNSCGAEGGVAVCHGRGRRKPEALGGNLSVAHSGNEHAWCRLTVLQP